MNLLEENNTCILIGNGPSIMKNKKGHIIDNFDEVLRFNRFKIKGFEEFTGTKTTIWATFGKGELPQDDEYRPAKILFTHGEMGRPAYNTDNLWRIPINYYNTLRKKLQDASSFKQSEAIHLLPSSGFLVINWILDFYPKHDITLAGFDHFSKEFSGQHHYWLKQSFKKPKEHDGETEKEMLQHFFDQQRLSYLDM